MTAAGRHPKRRRAATLFAVACAASTLGKSPAADLPGGFVGKGQVVIATVVAGAKIVAGGNIALEQRDSEVRIDVLSLGFPGADPTTSALLGTQLFPPGGFTVVAHGGLEYTVWSNATKRYFTGFNPAPTASAAPTPAPTATPSVSGPFKALATLKDLQGFSITLALAGHAVINGHPTTGLAYQFARVEKNGDATDVHGRLEIADDLEGIPVEITGSVKSKTIPESSLKLDLTSVAKQTPGQTDFEVPPGYSRAATLFDVIGRTLPH